MSEPKFKKGDKVRYIGSTYDELKGVIGTVMFVDDIHPCLTLRNAVAFEGFSGGHTCLGYVPTCNGLWIPDSDLELIKEPSLRNPETGSLSCECENESCCLKEPCDTPVEPTTPHIYYDDHYDGDVQPIEVMQMIMTPEQFIGFLMGNIIKYSMRCGKKDAPEKELTKIRRYKMWLEQARRGEIINPCL